MRTLIAVLGLLGAGSSGPASATNLVLNPNFDNTASTLHWTGGMGVFPNVGHNSFYSMGTLCSRAVSLTKASCAESQTIATTIGDSYDISFWAYNSAVSGATNQQFRTLFGGTDFGTTSYTVNQVWTEFTMTATATTASTVFKIYGRNDSGGIYFDDFSISESAVATVPEPALAGLFGLGVLSLGILRRTDPMAVCKDARGVRH